MSKGKMMFLVLAGALVTVNQAMAGGDVDIDLRCRSPSQSIVYALGNNSYGDAADRYTWSSPVIALAEEGYVDVLYRDVKPYVLRDNIFKANPNYYRTGMSGTEGWWIFADSDSADFPPAAVSSVRHTYDQ
jgi:hypothetical protein